MNISLKQRLIGAAVLIALAVIFLPMLLDGPDGDGQHARVDMEIPPEPQYAFDPPKPAEEAETDAPAATRSPGLEAPNDEPVSAARADQAPVESPAESVPPETSAGSGALEPPEEMQAQSRPDESSAPNAAAQDGQDGGEHPESRDSEEAQEEPRREAREEVSGEPQDRAEDTSPAAGEGWVVQVGSFSRQDNAVVLRDKLRANGFEAFAERAGAGESAMFRVRVGPEAERNAAEALQARLASEADLKGFVTAHP